MKSLRVTQVFVKASWFKIRSLLIFFWAQPVEDMMLFVVSIFFESMRTVFKVSDEHYEYFFQLNWDSTRNCGFLYVRVIQSTKSRAGEYSCHPTDYWCGITSEIIKKMHNPAWINISNCHKVCICEKVLKLSRRVCAIQSYGTCDRCTRKNLLKTNFEKCIWIYFFLYPVVCFVMTLLSLITSGLQPHRGTCSFCYKWSLMWIKREFINQNQIRGRIIKIRFRGSNSNQCSSFETK